MHEKSKNEVISSIKNTNIIYIVLSFFIVVIISTFLEKYLLYHDSAVYWKLSELFTSNNKFDFLSYNENLRGYVFPFFIFIIRIISEILKMSYTLYVANAIMYSVMIGYFIPKIFEKLFNKKTNNISIIIFFSIIFIFWRGYFGQALSDFPALFASILSFYFILNINICKKIWTVFNILMSGIFLAIAINIRPSYNIIIPIIFIYLILKIKREYFEKNTKVKIKNYATSILIIICGTLIILLPQIFINAKNFNTISPFVLGNHEGSNLFVSQLLWGMQMQKYESSIGANISSSESKVIFEDLSGKKIIEQEHISKDNFNIKTYIKLAIKYPVSFIKIYSKHIFNALDIKYSTPYIENIFQLSTLFSITNYTLWYIFILAMIKLFKNNKIKNFNMIIFLILIFFAVAISIPTAIEVRFMLPLYILCYGIILFSGAFNDLKIFNRKNNFKSILSDLLIEFKPLMYLVFIVLCFTLSAETYSCLSGFPIAL